MDITVHELKEKMDKGEQFVLLDVREPIEREEFNIGGDFIPIGIHSTDPGRHALGTEPRRKLTDTSGCCTSKVERA